MQKKRIILIKQNRIKQSVGSRVFDVFLYLFMIAFTFCMVYPFWNQLVISLNEGSDTVLGGITFLPRKFTLQNYIYIFQRQNLPKGAAMSVARCVVGTFTSIVCTALLGYIVTIKHFAGRKFMQNCNDHYNVFWWWNDPTYLLYSSIGLTDSFAVYWLPGLLSAYNMILVSSFIEGIQVHLQSLRGLMVHQRFVSFLRSFFHFVSQLLQHLQL